jgi:hypothetical protein
MRTFEVTMRDVFRDERTQVPFPERQMCLLSAW